MASIRAHRESNTLIITKNSSYTKPIAHHVNLILGINARCMERVAVDGSLEMGKKSQITGDVRANKAILGPGSVIYGDLTVEGDLVALDNAKVTGHVLVVGAAFIRPGVEFGSLDASGLIEIQGKPPSKHIKGKMVVNDAEDYPEATKKANAEALKVPHEKPAPVILPPKVPPAKAQPPKGPGKAPAKGKPRPGQKNKPKKAAGEKPKRKGFFGLFK